jgi:hypothetical protein
MTVGIKPEHEHPPLPDQRGVRGLGTIGWAGEVTDDTRAADTRGDHRVIVDDFDPQKSAKPLKSNETEKRRNHRQNSSKVVKTDHNPLIQHAFQ